MDQETKSRVFAILSRITGRNYENINLDDDLSSQIILDSIQVVEFFAALEEEFNIELPLSLMTVRNGNTFFRLLGEQLKT
jgi:acyl carrier protein